MTLASTDITEEAEQSDYSLLLFAVDKLFVNHFSNSFIENIVNIFHVIKQWNKTVFVNNVNVANTQTHAQFYENSELLLKFKFNFPTYALNWFQITRKKLSGKQSIIEVIKKTLIANHEDLLSTHNKNEVPVNLWPPQFKSHAKYYQPIKLKSVFSRDNARNVQ